MAGAPFGQRLRVGAASVRGPAHARADSPNQDAYAYYVGPGLVAAAVSDGLGSRPDSHEGARWAATCAVLHAVEYLLAGDAHLLPSTRAAQLQFRILQAWRTRFGDKSQDYACTLAFTALTEDRAVFGQIGDSPVWPVQPGESGVWAVLGETDKEFLNVTNSLADKDAFTRFTVKELERPLELMQGVVLMTDGVADDLSDRDLFVKSVLGALGTQTRGHWDDYLDSMLRTWETPSHYDDKTLVVVHFADSASVEARPARDPSLGAGGEASGAPAGRMNGAGEGLKPNTTGWESGSAAGAVRATRGEAG